MAPWSSRDDRGAGAGGAELVGLSVLTIDLIIVDDEALARAGLRMILEGQHDMRIASSARG